MAATNLHPQTPAEALGQSEEFLAFQEQLSRVAPIERPVLIFGERGTGKELAAARLHFLSRRWQGPFVALNCAALNPALIEAELFGHERGAFTGAVQRRRGRFEAADGGTLFLDELGAVPFETQEKILRVVEYGGFERVGSSATVEVNVRIVGATNADLARQALQGSFKRDLLDRLSFEVLFVPPLRLRKGDISFLADHFAQRMAFELGWKQMPTFSPAAAGELERWPWPGNVRELKNVVERAVYRSDSADIAQITFDPFLSPWAPQPPSVPAGPPKLQPPPRFSEPIRSSLVDAVRELEIAMIRRCLIETRFNRRQAAKRLGLTYDQLRSRMRKYADELDGPADQDPQP